ncbi:MAG: TVP38/TMEM64 family protein [Proteobacteria bacterium]|nr:TVP38/TMEM64 family protein [Pseudomonadota bacterium]
MNDSTTSQPGRASFQAILVRRILPIAVLIAGFVAFFALDLNRFVSLEALKENRETLDMLVRDNGIVAILAFAAIYAVVVAFSLPGGAIMTLAGGFLFGAIGGGLIVVLAATVGATALFLIARTALGDVLRAKAGPFLSKMEQGFRQNALSYLLVLRLVPLFPFWLVNLVPAFLGVSTTTYIVGTFIGIIPGTFVYASVGNGLGALIDAGQDPDLGIIFRPEILGPLIGLAVLALVPVIYKRIQARKNRSPTAAS